MAKKKNLGMVKMIMIGQSASLLSNDDMLVYGRATETQRRWDFSEGLSSQRNSKI